MTEQEKELIIDVAIGNASEQSLLKKFATPAAETDKLVLRLLNEAFVERDADGIECALIVGFIFGFSSRHRQILCDILDANWHRRHEDAVSALAALRSPESIDSLFRAATARFDYLAFDESRALGTKAVSALSAIGDPAAAEKLRLLVESKDAVVSRKAKQRLAAISNDNECE